MFFFYINIYFIACKSHFHNRPLGFKSLMQRSYLNLNYIQHICKLHSRPTHTFQAVNVKSFKNNTKELNEAITFITYTDLCVAINEIKI